MKSKILITLLAVIVCLSLSGFVVIGGSDHDDDEHERIENITNSDHYDELESHNENEDSEDQEQAIEITPEEIQEIGLETAVAGNGTIEIQINLIGEIKINQDRIAHIVPRVEGIVIEVDNKLGDFIQAGEIAAVIESRELADIKASYIASFERYQIAKLNFEREEQLWKEKISSEQDYLDKKQALTEASIGKRAVQQKLQAIGYDEFYLQKLISESEQFLTRFELKAPFEGTIIEKNIVYGELVGTESRVFVIADMNTVWVDLQVYPNDLKYIRKGQRVIISADSEIPEVNGVIDYLGPIVGTESRTALARVVLSNESGIFRPGLFVDAKVSVSQTKAKVVVPKVSIQTLEGRKCVFVKNEHGFEPAFIEVGLEDTNKVEILSGLTAGQEYVTKGAFALKSKVTTSTLDSHAGHGH